MTGGGVRRRCPGCFLIPAKCVCAEIPRIESPLDFLILRHCREATKSSNTGRLAAAAVESCQLLDLGELAEPFDASRVPADSWLLFPPDLDEFGQETGRHRLLSAEDGPPPGPLVILDGTWGQARRMSHRIKVLDDLPRLILDPGPELPYRLRKAHVPGAMATLEVVARAIEVFDDPAKAGLLRRLYENFALRLRSRYRAPPRKARP